MTNEHHGFSVSDSGRPVACVQCSVTGNCAKHPGLVTTVYDNYGSKIEGWQLAVQCFCLVMKMGDVVTTGVSMSSPTLLSDHILF